MGLRRPRLRDAGLSFGPPFAITSAYAEHNERERAWMSSLTEPERTVLNGLLEKLITGPSAKVAKQRF